MALLEVRNLVKRYRSPDGEEQEVVRVAEFNLNAGEELAIRGESGSGKTTFLQLISGILRADSGSIVLSGEDLTQLSEQERDARRARQIGFIFQSFNLLQAFKTSMNVELPIMLAGGSDRARATALLQRVGLTHRADHFPRQLSSGQQQRVAIARALANKPALVLADEPTGSLDARNATETLKLIREVCRENGAALLLVSHDAATLSEFERVIDFAAINRPQQESATR
ncbi:MAG TPA: ABC transporter ATP-binding protein [Methylomirabilota bacterium]|nr:ABC transporter ATP-binding protein [Methylomirabilota bacterium]